MAGFGIRDGHVRAIRKVDGPRSYHVEFGSQTASEAGSKGSAISQEDETVNGDLLLNCNIAGPTFPILIFPKMSIPGNVKLCEPPGRTGGLPK